jgi:thiamine pyrophosphate-dependent acetolactate synthase large subunit-like protein
MKPERREILYELKPALKETDLVVAALAGTTADSYQVIDRPGNLYLVGMGMVSQIALGLATALPNCRIFALDTDGSMLLAPSILPVIGTRQPKNLYILVFDNEQLFGSRGGPASQTATGTDIAGIAKASGLENVRTLRDKNSLRASPGAIPAAFSGTKDHLRSGGQRK